MLLVFLLWEELGDEFMNEDPVEYVYKEQAFENPENFAGKMIITPDITSIFTC